MIVVGCTEEAEARDMADLLRTGLPPDREYQVYCNGQEFTSSNDEDASSVRREEVLRLLGESGPGGTTVRDLRIQLNRAGHRTAPATLYRWLGAYLGDGRVTHDGAKWALARKEGPS